VHTESGRDLAAVKGERLRQLSGDDALASNVVMSVAGDEVSTDLHEALIGYVTHLEAGLPACSGKGCVGHGKAWHTA
jgi:hypothetical protein